MAKILFYKYKYNGKYDVQNTYIEAKGINRKTFGDQTSTQSSMEL